MTDIMLDLETWGTLPGCDIRSIGAVKFDPNNGFIEYETAFYRNVDNPVRPDARPQYSDPNGFCSDRAYPLIRDPSTVKWWNDQSDAARSAFTNPVDLHEGLRDFTSWFINMYPAPWDGKTSDAVTLWCNGPHFDEVILKGCFIACNLPIPWHYRAPRDFRTEMEGAGWPMIPFEGVEHNALDDAIHQARCIIECRKLRPVVLT